MTKTQNNLRSAMQQAKREALTQGRDGQQLSLAQIVLPNEQPRRYFDQSAMDALVTSVRKKGILQPLLVRPLADDLFELVAGERRLLAAQTAELATVPVFVAVLSDEEAKEAALTENLQRENINPVEETEAILQLLALKLGVEVVEAVSLLYTRQNEYKGKSTHNVMGRQKDVIDEVFASTTTMNWLSFVANRLPLLKLPKDVLEALKRGEIAYTKALLIARIGADKARKRLLKQAITEKLSVEVVRSRVKELTAKPGTSQSQQTLARVRRLPALVKKSQALQDDQLKARVDKLISELEELLGGTGS